MTHPKRPRDPNQLAKSIIDIATGEAPATPQMTKTPLRSSGAVCGWPEGRDGKSRQVVRHRAGGRRQKGSHYSLEQRLDYRRKIFELVLVAGGRSVHLQPTIFHRVEVPRMAA
jgi:hypothetical protein